MNKSIFLANCLFLLFCSYHSSAQQLKVSAESVKLSNLTSVNETVKDAEKENLARRFSTTNPEVIFANVSNESNTVAPKIFDHSNLMQGISYLVKYLDRLNQPTISPSSASLLLKNVRSLDKEDCLLRIICEISSNQDDLADNDLVKNIRKRFGNSKHAPSYPIKLDHAFPFYYAGHVGKISGAAERCLQVFPVCKLPSDQILQLLATTSKMIRLNQSNNPNKLNTKLEKDLFKSVESKSFSDKMRNKMKKLHKQYMRKTQKK